MMVRKNPSLLFLALILCVAVVGCFWFIAKTDAFSGPPGPPGPLTGSPLKFDSNGNFAIGGNVQSDVRLLLQGDSTVNGLIVFKEDGVTPVLQVHDDVLIGNPTGDTLTGGFGISLRATGIRASSSYFEDLEVNNARVYGDIVGEAGSIIEGFQYIYADNVSSTFDASNISAGIFPAGDFAFGQTSKVGISTSSQDNLPATLSVYGTSYFSGNMGIGIDPYSLAEPASLNIGSSPLWLSNFNKGIRLEGNSAVEFGGGSGGTLYGMGSTGNRLYIFNTNTEFNTGVAPSFYNLTLNSSGVGIGIGATDPSATLHVSGTLRVTTGFQFPTSTASSGRVLTTDASGNATWADAGGIGAGSSGDTARYNGSSWIASTLLYNNSSFIGVSTTVETTGTLLKIGSGGYFQIDKYFSGSSPTASDCDNSAEQGRITYGTVSSDNFMYVCMGASGWKYVKLN